MSESRVQQILGGVFASVGDDDDDDAADLPGLLCTACVAALPVDGAGISLIDDGRVQMMVTATDARARALEELQFTLGEGPCLDAFGTGRPVSHPDLAAPGGAGARWPGFGRAATDAGVAAVFAFPLQIGGIRLGVLDLYRSSPGGLDDAQTVEALAFTDAATLLLLHLQDRAPPGQLPHQVDSAWTGRKHVHQATGMISVQAGVRLADALALLRARAFTDDRGLGDVAADVVARRLRFDPDGDGNDDSNLDSGEDGSENG